MQCDEDYVIYLLRSTKNNTVPEISKKTGFSIKRVHKIIDEHLNNKEYAKKETNQDLICVNRLHSKGYINGVTYSKITGMIIENLNKINK